MGKLRAGLARVKKQLAEGTAPAPPMDPEIKMALEIGFAFEKALGDYVHRPALRYFTNLGTEGIKPITLGHLRNAAKIALLNKVDAETHVQSQFYWMDKWFRRAPKIRELGSATKGGHNATWRLLEFLKLHVDDRRKVSSKVMPGKAVTPEKLDKINQQRLKQLAESWEKSPTEILEIFAPSGVFDQSWLEKNPIYCQLRENGKL